MPYHPEEHAFLKAIWKKPKDLTLRLVYADWLDEHGQEWLAGAVRYWCGIDPEDRELLMEGRTRPSARFWIGALVRKEIRKWVETVVHYKNMPLPEDCTALVHLYQYARLGRPPKA